MLRLSFVSLLNSMAKWFRGMLCNHITIKISEFRINCVTSVFIIDLLQYWFNLKIF